MSKTIDLIENGFDTILFEAFGDGKSNGIAITLKNLLKALKFKCDYVTGEDEQTFIEPATNLYGHSILAELDTMLQVTDHSAHADLRDSLTKPKGVNIWVMDGMQDFLLTTEQYAELKNLFEPGKKQKMIVSLSWEKGKAPSRGIDKAVKYRCNIKLSIGNYSFSRKVVMKETDLTFFNTQLKQPPKIIKKKMTTTSVKDRDHQQKTKQKRSGHVQKKQ